MLLLSKTSSWCESAQRFVRAHVPDAIVVHGERHDPLPATVADWSGDYIVSFLCPWVLPAATLGRARKAALNFHPAPPEYPGTGCYNFAIYDSAAQYGVTCHHMLPRVDSGPIVRVLRFPLLPDDTVALLKERSMSYLLTLFYEVLGVIAVGGSLPRSREKWTGKARRRAELDELCRITGDMSIAEIERRVRATTFPGAPGPFFEADGRRFDVTSELKIARP